MIDFGENPEIARVLELFQNAFGNTTGSVLHLSPASLMLLGDHTHYNEGILISACVDKSWVFILKKRKDKEINILTPDSNEIVNFSLQNTDGDNKDQRKLLKGLIGLLNEENLLSSGFDCIVSTNVPECLGLGSYAAYQVGFMNAVKKLYSLELDEIKILDLIRRNEVKLIGRISNAGHHYTAQFAKDKRLLYIDLRTMERKYISVDDESMTLVICDTGKEVTDPSKVCNERIDECEIGVRGLRLYIWGIKTLRDVGKDFLLKHYHMLPKRIFNRILYNVKERNRAEEAIKLLKRKSYAEFGKLIFESHRNLSEDYELSSDRCDFLVAEAALIEPVLAAKMISCSPILSTFNLVATGGVEEFTARIQKAYENRYDGRLKIHVLKLTGGVKKLSSKEIEHHWR
jgi:galactokinase